MLKHLILWIGRIGTLLILTIPAHGAAKPQVMVTIKPIHALVSGVMEGVGNPYLLLQGGESVHSYSLRPSQVRKLRAANLVIWIGPTVETFLEKFLHSDKTQQLRLRLIELPDLNLLKTRKGGVWQNHFYSVSKQSHEVSRTQVSRTQVSRTQIDPHIWLDPRNAQIIVSAVAHTLSKLDPSNAIRYMTNATHLTSRLEQLDQAIKHQLAPSKDLPYLVFHDAYQYFEHRYGLATVGAITLSPEMRPSARRLHRLRTQMRNKKIRCIFSEPQFKSPLIAILIENTDTMSATLDPLGADLAAGTKAYFTLLGNLAKSLNQCLLF